MKIIELTEDAVLDESLSRILSQAETKDFAIITAYRDIFTKEQNIARNRNLRAVLNNNGLGVHPLVGHWQECQDPKIPYSQCPTDKLVDVIERSYFVVRSETDKNKMDQNTFKNLILTLAGQYNQNAVVLKLGKDIKTIAPNGTEIENLGTKIAIDKISQAYSQYVRNLNRPFIFETDHEELDSYKDD